MLNKTKFTFFTQGEIKPAGWLKRQLEIQAQSLSGNLDKVWPDVRDSRWIGGDRDGWERVPYWLDGFIPLAYLLEDRDLIDRAKRYVDGIISQQCEDGWICPCSVEERRNYDLWSCILIAKVLAMYADLSGDGSIENVVYRLMNNMWVFIRHTTIDNWAAMRWFEMLIPLYWLYERRPEDWMLRLADRLQEQGYDYKRLFDNYHDQKPERIWTYYTHVVNLAMAIKQEALVTRKDGGDPEAYAKKMLDTLFTYHGMAVGHFTGDECLMGDSPVQGTELCGVVEAMYSYEQLLEISGDPLWGDYLEKLAFNALPATISADMWTHQYVQQTNQIRCSRLPEDHVTWGTNSPEANMFGLEPNFGCCTANFNQGWPKLAMSAFMRTEDGLASTVLVPARVATEINGAAVQCELITEYPFRDTLVYRVSVDNPVEFELSLRIPAGAESATVDGEPAVPGAFYTVKRLWSDTTEVTVKLEFACRLVDRPRNMKVLWRGPLLYSVAIKERWKMLEYTRNGVERKFPYCDYEVYPESRWNYAFADESGFVVKEAPVGAFPFDGAQPPVEITAPMAPVDWREEYGVAAIQPVSNRPIGPTREVRMIPYGCARLRMTEMPMAEKQ